MVATAPREAGVDAGARPARRAGDANDAALQVDSLTKVYGRDLVANDGISLPRARCLDDRWPRVGRAGDRPPRLSHGLDETADLRAG